MGVPCDKDLYTPLCPKTGETLFIPPSEMKYDTSWDWLMPVIEKCSRLNQKINVIPGKGYHYAINSFDDDFNIDHSYKAVVKFIKLYNQVS